ncbi:branched-chain alpha-keto acid dehydrogenase subunit E2 [Salipiger aestuarii]|uniref:dihydrolipoyllysine-residue acetyltransferase n=1 Tax=Salipiger aestuarii TaxID=568098 RepID=UPI00123C0B52|nr:dihydrolipoyllysine-residue acetyltransferase [Salipiger aestuarii]KAA8605742.1 branched-chain alpha-keto acid dehydrogenase subunit E2 [Salipiger aestuarii]
MTNTIDVKVPDIGDFSNVLVIEINVSVGDIVAKDDPILMLESDKATLDIPAPTGGKIAAIHVVEGDKLSEGSLVMTLEAAGEVPEADTARPDVREAADAVPELSASAAAPAEGAALTGKIEILVPDIGDFTDVPVIEIVIAVGDIIDVDDTVVILESDKATLDVPSAVAGRVVELLVAEGDKVSRGSLLAVVAPESAAPAPTPTAVPAAAAAATVARPTPTPSAPAQPARLAHASPAIRKFARELGVDINAVSGTGPKGRITREDVQDFVKTALAAPSAPAASGADRGLDLLPWPKVDFAKFGEIERVPLSRIARISGPSLARNATIIPHVTNFEDADVTDLEAFRKMVNSEAKDGTKLSILPFVVKAAVAALKQFPKFNASLDGDGLILKKYYNIGVAADTPEGLVVPVIKDADKKGIYDIAAEMTKLAGAARAGKLKVGDMQGATFTISSLGGIGGTNFTPIINAPEVAIFGMTRSAIRPVWDGAAFQPRLVQPMSLSWDHRVVDGVAAAHFLVTMKTILSDFRRISL